MIRLNILCNVQPLDKPNSAYMEIGLNVFHYFSDIVSLNVGNIF